jgi:hypothetical protein
VSNPNPQLIKLYLANLLRALEEKAEHQSEKHCRRLDGTVRAWFLTKEAAEAVEATHPNYHGDVAHLCQHCGFWHLCRPQWLETEKWAN